MKAIFRTEVQRGYSTIQFSKVGNIRGECPDKIGGVARTNRLMRMQDELERINANVVRSADKADKWSEKAQNRASNRKY